MAGIVTYDTVVVQQGQCLMDVALQHYGTTDPQALIALVQDNGLDSVTAEVKAGDMIKIRKDAEWGNKRVVDYYRNNNLNPATAISSSGSIENLIASIYDYSGNGYAWINNTLTFINVYGFCAFGLLLSESITAPFGIILHVRSDIPISFYLEFGDYYSQYQNVMDIDIQLTSTIENIDEIYIAFNYGNINQQYSVTLIAEKQTLQAA